MGKLISLLFLCLKIVINLDLIHKINLEVNLFMIRLTDNLNEGRNSIKKVLIGSGVSIIITIFGLIIFASLLTYTSIAESTPAFAM